jgi:hypothetical protein
MLYRIDRLSFMQPHYFSELIIAANQLLSPEEREELNKKIFEVEKMVFETEMVPREMEDGSIVWVERIAGDLSLYDVEMAVESNPDYYAFFEREDGTVITKFDIERKLNKIKQWIFDIVRKRSEGKRFSRF